MDAINQVRDSQSFVEQPASQNQGLVPSVEINRIPPVHGS